MKTFIKHAPDEYSRTFKVLLLFLDVFAVVTAFYLLSLGLAETLANSSDLYTFGLAWLLLWISVSNFTGVYQARKQKKMYRMFGNTLKVALIHLPLAIGLAFILGVSNLTIELLLSLYGLHIAVSLLIKGTLLLIYQYLRNLESNRSTYVIVGFTPAGKNLYKFFNYERSAGYRFAGFFDDLNKHSLVIGEVAELKRYCLDNEVDEIFFALPYDREMIHEISGFADDNFIRFGVLQDIGACAVDTEDPIVYHDDMPVLPVKTRNNHQKPVKSYYKALSIIKSWNF